MSRLGSIRCFFCDSRPDDRTFGLRKIGRQKNGTPIEVCTCDAHTSHQLSPQDHDKIREALAGLVGGDAE